ncbi:MAG: hypothetical protein ACP5VF_03710 [Acidobacteriota bacterium]
MRGDVTLRAAILAALALCSVPALAVGLLASPVQLGLVGRPGQTVSGVVQVSASNNQDTPIRVTFGNFTKDEEGRLVELAEGAEQPRSCLAWLSASQLTFTAPAQGRASIQVSAQIPEGVSGSYWAFVAFSAPPPPRNGGGTSLLFMPRVIIPVIVSVEGTLAPKVQFQATTARYDPVLGGVEAKAILVNTGNAAVLINGAFALEQQGPGDTSPNEVGEKEVGPLTSLPGTRLVAKGLIPWSGPWTGLQVHSYLRYGPEPDQAAESVTSIADLPAGAASGRLAPEAPMPPAASQTPPAAGQAPPPQAPAAPSKEGGKP